MATLDKTNIKEEIRTWLRNNDFISTSDRGVTRVTEEFNGDGNETEFTLAQNNVKNVKAVTVDGSPITFGSGYTVSYGTSTVVTFATAPGIGTNNVDIQNDYGATDKIFSSFPKSRIQIADIPRISFQIIMIDTADVGFGNNSVSDVDIEVVAYDDKRSEVDNIIDAIRGQLITDRDSFFYLKRMIPVSTGPVLISALKGAKVFQSTLGIRSILNYEKN